MQVFEYYFNPKLKPDLIFESFCFEPENIYEKRVGSLYMLGVLKNALPPKAHLLDKLSKVIKEKYYTPTAKSPEKSLKDSLKRANEFLEDLTKGGDVSWLGNLSFATLSIKNLELNFSKVGDVKIFLLRGNKLTDIDKKVKIEDIEPYPLKIFLNVVAGKLTEDDIILVLSKEIFEFFEQEDLLSEMTKICPFKEKKFREILSNKEKKFTALSGICLLIVLSSEKLAARKKTIMAQLEEKEFSFKEILPVIISFFKKLKLPKIKLPSLALPLLILPKPKIPQFEFFLDGLRDKLENLKLKSQIFFKKKKVILVLSLIFLFIVGFFIFQREAKKQIIEHKNILSQIQEQKTLAESLLILSSPQSLSEANLLFKESWTKLSPLVKIASTLPKDLKEEILTLKDEISGNLYQLNNLVKIPEPQVLFEFKSKEFIPQAMMSDGKNLYFFSPYSDNLFKVNYQGESQLIKTQQRFDLALSFDEEILFFLKPNKIISFKEGQFGETFVLETPYLDFDFQSFSVFKSNLYFLDKKVGQIVKYPYLGNLRWDFPQTWLAPQTKKVVGANSIAVNGSVWILDKNSINRYYSGQLQESLNLNFFPAAENLSKIFTSSSLPYLYILEPAQKRIIILNKSGEIIKQFQSEKFDNLLDFAISQNGKTIWLLNGLKVYQIEF